MTLGIGKVSCKKLGIKESQVKLIDDLATGDFYTWNNLREEYQKHFPNTDKWIASCYNMPRRYEVIMNMFNELLEGFGVEAIESDRYIDNYFRYFCMEYVNLGDTYDLTIVYLTEEDRFICSSYGDMIEFFERKGYKFN
jgi:hypothetical protein